MDHNRHRDERCASCRNWHGGTRSCHRYAPAPVGLGREPGAAAPEPGTAVTVAVAWPHTGPDEWCGEWKPDQVRTVEPNRSVPGPGECAAELFLHRIIPAAETADAAPLLRPLLDQLPHDTRLVVVRANGLDGKPLTGIREISKELRMSRDRVLTLLAIGEEQLAEALVVLVARHRRGREAFGEGESGEAARAPVLGTGPPTGRTPRPGTLHVRCE